jgi:hypothetical protein
MYNIPYLILGLIFTFAIPLGLLWLVTTYSDKQNKDEEG